MTRTCNGPGCRRRLPVAAAPQLRYCRRVCQQRAYFARKDGPRPPRVCGNPDCRALIPPTVHAARRYCTVLCRDHAWYVATRDRPPPAPA